MAKTKNKSESDRQIKKKGPLKYYLIMILIPVLFFILLEIILRITGFGYDFSLFIPAKNTSPEMLEQNPDMAFKYFDNIATSNIEPEGFYKKKKKGTFRIFVLGASSAAGFPYNSDCSFSRQLKRMLEISFPEIYFEVVNLGSTAINSYTILDYAPSIPKQKPDMVIIYAGHNEYYGALGVASTTRIGNSRAVTEFILSLRDYRIYQLLQDMIGLFSPGKEEKLGSGKSETSVPGFRINTRNLMESMIDKNYIPYGSGLYKAGISQFRENMDEVLKKLTGNHIPVIISTLTSNIKDQRPFYTSNAAGLKKATDKYNLAVAELKANDIQKAKQLFIEAKKLDGVRFRAPEEINREIVSMAKKYGCILADIDSLFSVNSKDHITGDELICDHLHPNFYGYRLMGRKYYGIVKDYIEQNLDKEPVMDNGSLDSIMNARYPFSELDSAQAGLMLRILTGSYPYTPKGVPNKLLEEYKPDSYLDTMMLKYKSSARPYIAAWYVENLRFGRFSSELRILLEETPLSGTGYETLLKILHETGLYKHALPFMKGVLEEHPDNALEEKWLAAVDNDYKTYLDSLKITANENDKEKSDAFIYYKRGRAELQKNELQSALDDYNKALELDSNMYEAYNDRAVIMLKLFNDNEKALKDFNRSLELNPEYEEAYVNRAYYYYLNEKDALSLKDLNKALELNEKNPRSFYIRGLVYQRIKKTNKACEDWNRSLELGFQPAAELIKKNCR